MLRIALVSCGKQKLAVPAPAKELYCSPLFKKTRAYVEGHYDRWLILSALHLVLEPDQPVRPYDMPMPTGRQAQYLWTVQAACRVLLMIPPGCAIDLFAGEDYGGVSGGLERAGHVVHRPLSGLQVGQRLQWLNARLADATASARPAATRDLAPAPSTG
jgi:hypothetical protein